MRRLLRHPGFTAACVGVCAGWGSYASTRLLGERILVGELVPVLMMIPLLGMALGPVVRARSRLTRPGTVAGATALLSSAVAASAHQFYLPAKLMFPGPVRPPEPLLGVALAVLIIVTAVPFAVLGRACGEAFRRGAHPAIVSGLESAGFAVGSAASYLWIRKIGGYEAFLVFLVAATCFVSGAWPKVVAVASTLVAAIVVHTKQPSFFTWELRSFDWQATQWSPNQKLDAVTFQDCAAIMYNNYLFYYVCPRTGTELNHVRDLSTEIGKRVPVHTIVNLGSAAGLTPFTLLPAFPETRSYYAIEIEGTVLSWARSWFRDRGGAIYDDPRVTTVATEGRRFLAVHDLRADFIFVDGIDTPFITSQVLPVARGAFFFTREGYASLFEHLTEDGFIIIETGGSTPANFAPIIQAAPEDAKITAVWYVNTTFPMVGMPHFWVALTRSSRTFAALREAFASVPSARPVEVPARFYKTSPTDDRPLVFHNRSMHTLISAGALALLAIPAWLTRHSRRGVARHQRIALLCIGAGGTALQVSTISALSRAFEAPATGLAVLLAANLTGSALGSMSAEAQVRLLASRPGLGKVVGWIGAFVVVACFPFFQMAALDPFAHGEAAIPLALLVGVPGGFLWSRALSSVPAHERGTALALDLLGAVWIAGAAPAIVAWSGQSWLILGGAIALVVATIVRNRATVGFESVVDGSA